MKLWTAIILALLLALPVDMGHAITTSAFSRHRQMVTPTKTAKKSHGVEVQKDAKTQRFSKASKWLRDEQRFVQEVTPMAQRIGAKYGVPAGAMIAQAVIESAHGTSWLAKNHNAYFGIKADARWDGPSAYRGGCRYRSYDSMEASFEDYCRFLKNNRRYAHVFKETQTMPFIRKVLRAGYCPTSNYPDMAEQITDRYNLL